MSSTRAGNDPDERDAHWTTETLPLAVRKELLARELSQLGFRKAGPGASAREGGTAPQQQPKQQQPEEADDAHPRAPADGGKPR